MQHFRKLHKIGQGAFGRVYIVQDTNAAIPQQYVMKEVDLCALVGLSDEQAKAQALGEVNYMNELREHPGIISAVGCYEDTQMKQLFIVMEYCAGGDLDRAVQIARMNNQPFSEAKIISWFVQACLALEHCHAKNVLHRDIKTPNIFLTADQSKLKLGDFGIARTLENTQAKAKTCIGTPCYFSPELVMNKEYDAKSDVWAMGVVLYELMALQRPFDMSNPQKMQRDILKAKPLTMPKHAKQYSAKLKGLMEQMLKKKAKDRPTVSEILNMPFLQASIKAEVARMTKEFNCATCRVRFGVPSSMAPGTMVACPNCKVHTMIPKQAPQVQVLPIGGAAQAPIPPPVAVCQECENGAAGVHFYCKQCGTWMCAACDRALHSKGNRATHARVPMSQVAGQIQQQQQQQQLATQRMQQQQQQQQLATQQMTQQMTQMNMAAQPPQPQQAAGAGAGRRPSKGPPRRSGSSPAAAVGTPVFPFQQQQQQMQRAQQQQMVSFDCGKCGKPCQVNVNGVAQGAVVACPHCHAHNQIPASQPGAAAAAAPRPPPARPQAPAGARPAVNFQCPSCRAINAVPSGQGRVQVACPSCRGISVVQT